MKEKYINERFSEYFIFGSSEFGKVDVCNDRKVVATLDIQQAQTLLKDRREITNMIVKLAQKLDEVNQKEFKKIWNKE